MLFILGILTLRLVCPFAHYGDTSSHNFIGFSTRARQVILKVIKQYAAAHSLRHSSSKQTMRCGGDLLSTLLPNDWNSMHRDKQHIPLLWKSIFRFQWLKYLNRLFQSVCHLIPMIVIDIVIVYSIEIAYRLSKYVDWIFHICRNQTHQNE